MKQTIINFLEKAPTPTNKTNRKRKLETEEKVVFLYENGDSITKPDDGWNFNFRGGNGWSEGRHVWTIIPKKRAEGFSVGIIRNVEKMSFTDANVNIPNRYDVYGGNGNAVNTKDEDKPCLGKFKNGDEISVLLDMGEKTVTFFKNGKRPEEPTFENIGEGPWYPYCSILDLGCEIDIKKQKE